MLRSDLLVSCPVKNTVLVQFPNRYYATATFLRPQEFYESPYKELNGKYFDFETAMDVLAEKTGRFSYLDDYCGFNVPDYSLLKFIDLFKPTFGKKEKILFTCINPYIKKFLSAKVNFYVIGSIKGDKATINHEIAHAMYYLDEEYRDEMDDLMDDWKGTNKLVKKLLKFGYSEPMALDEVQAYCSTSKSFLRRMFNMSAPPSFGRVFNRFKPRNK